MKHLGDITKINWSEVEPVDVVTGGSPCQDLSVAGKRAGLAGERSGLYMEQIRCIKELRNADRLRGRTAQSVRPRYMVWENVTGAFSSNKGADFAAVLTEAIRIAEPQAPDVPVPEKGWNYSGYIYDEMGGWSVAWRTHDAQFWGVPQRRRRISLVCDFGGLTAGEILFKPESLSGHSEEGREEGQETAGGAGEGAAMAVYGIGGYNSEGMKSANPNSGIYKADTSRTLDLNGGNPACNQGGMMVLDKAYALRERAGCAGGGKGPLIQTEKTGTINVSNDQTIFCMATQQGGAEIRTDDKAPTLTAAAGMSGNNQPVMYRAVENQPQDSRVKLSDEDVCQSLTKQMGTGGGNVPLIFKSHPADSRVKEIEDDICPTLTAKWAKGAADTPLVCKGYAMQAIGEYSDCEVSSSLKQRDYKDATDLVVQPAFGVDCRNATENAEMTASLQSSSCHNLNSGNVIRDVMAVRRLTPLERERLQGFPDGWTDIGEWADSKGKKHKDADSPRYKALGNSIALPFWYWLLQNISEQYGYTPTLGSLFDGIGGFPLCWESINGKGTARWASEIEEFPIAVTKLRFKEAEE